MQRKWMILVGVIGGMLLLDQVSKAWILANLELYESIPLLPPLLHITRSYNTGAAFGIGDGASVVFLILALIITTVLLVTYGRAPAQRGLYLFALALIMGGALSNIVDRIQHGHVIDFVHITLPGIISNVSNFADHAIVVGVLLLIVENLLWERRERAEAAQDPATS